MFRECTEKISHIWNFYSLNLSLRSSTYTVINPGFRKRLRKLSTKKSRGSAWFPSCYLWAFPIYKAPTLRPQNSQTTSYPAIPAESLVSVPPRKELLTSSWGKSVKHHLGECMDSELFGEKIYQKNLKKHYTIPLCIQPNILWGSVFGTHKKPNLWRCLGVRIPPNTWRLDV